MPTCNVDMWVNGVILTSVGSGLLIVSAILRGAMKSVKDEYKYSDRIEMKEKLINNDIEQNDVGPRRRFKLDL